MSPSRWTCQTLPRLYCATSSPWSAARRYHRTASASSCGTPWPRLYLYPRLNCRVGEPLVSGQAEPPGRLGVVLGENAQAFVVPQPEAVLRRSRPLISQRPQLVERLLRVEACRGSECADTDQDGGKGDDACVVNRHARRHVTPPSEGGQRGHGPHGAGENAVGRAGVPTRSPMVLRLRGYFRVGVADSQKAAREPRFGFYEATWTQEVVRGAGGRASVMLPPVIMPLTAFVGAGERCRDRRPRGRPRGGLGADVP